MTRPDQIRVQIVATADDDGSNAASISPQDVARQLAVVDQIFAPADIRFVFDPARDFVRISSTLLNQDFSLMEPPNAGPDQWDHDPMRDAASHSTARTELAKQFGARLVIIYRNRRKVEQNETTKLYSIVPSGGGSSGARAHYVNMSTLSGANDLAHEIGHYLQLPHPFVDDIETVEAASKAIAQYLANGHGQSEGLDALDGDRHAVLDTPADCRGSIFLDEGLDPCGPVGSIPIPVKTPGGLVLPYMLAPDRSLVMSYFKGCAGAKTISPDQARRVRDALEQRLRHGLISSEPALDWKTGGRRRRGGRLDRRSLRRADPEWPDRHGRHRQRRRSQGHRMGRRKHGLEDHAARLDGRRSREPDRGLRDRSGSGRDRRDRRG
jgi:hypothetical protein